MRIPIFAIVLASSLGSVTIAQAYDPPPSSAAAVQEIDFDRATPLDEDYRFQFKRCDTENVFRGVQMSGFRRCSGDKNNVEALLKFPNGAIFFEAKMSLDIDGSFKACSDPGLADLCPTWHTWPNLTGRASFIDLDKIPFIVIPIAGPDRWKREFRDKTGVKAGDFAVVVFNGHVVPAMVGDGGPFNKLGEASNAVFKAVGKDRCRETNSTRSLHTISRRQPRVRRSLFRLSGHRIKEHHSGQRTGNDQVGGWTEI